ncbi:hypothetical protein [Micromonospora sp. HM5-17]|jgi:hypothetical protein|uniref:hypothetical protein n=1 Tax=Micromonospora sp. HM5-17 TaxID=2487710 RepID=UPI000F4AAA95|nr:hypothetical protein [Micromonospora sp. HM5-17]ROT32388.1 hypothetical protein EF879_12610 [Micromonospora sp. HM5-17]
MRTSLWDGELVRLRATVPRYDVHHLASADRTVDARSVFRFEPWCSAAQRRPEPADVTTRQRLYHTHRVDIRACNVASSESHDKPGFVTGCPPREQEYFHDGHRDVVLTGLFGFDPLTTPRGAG